MGKVIGIDLGTTNSCVAVMEGGKPVIIPNSEGRRTTPSVVAFTKSGERLVGEAALRQAVTNSERTISSIKREMGSNYKIKIDGKEYSPQEISAMILMKLKRDAEYYIEEDITEAVITVPAYFTDAQRQATKDAGKIAGLEVHRIINEPTAAAVAYGVDKEESQKVLVYDLGGGTFDVSVLNIEDGVIEVLATAGNNRLGGDDFDQCVVDYLLLEVKKQKKVDLSSDPVALGRLREAAVNAKIELSQSMSAQINLPYLTTEKSKEPIHLDMTIPRQIFDELTEHLVKMTTAPVQQALADSHVGVNELSKVILVGGSTRIPAVQEEVRKITGKAGYKGIHPDECVALGAALQGGVLVGEITGLLLLDVTPLSLGIETLGGMCTPVIERNTSIPISKSQVFTTAANFQPSVEIHVLQGERPKATQNRTLGKFKLKGIQRAMRGVPQIEVTFTIDSNGIVVVGAKDLKTGKQQDIMIESSANMSDDEIQDAIRDAEMYASEDAKFRSESEAKSNLEALIYQADKLISEKKDLSKEEKSELSQKVKEARKALKSKDPGEINAAKMSLEKILALHGNHYDSEQDNEEDFDYDDEEEDDRDYYNDEDEDDSVEYDDILEFDYVKEGKDE